MHKNLVSKPLQLLCVSVVAFMILQLSHGGIFGRPTASPGCRRALHRNQSVIVLIGESRASDHLFANYIPKGDNSVSNSFSKRIINSDGIPGPYFKKAAQFQATPPFKTEYYIGLKKNQKTPYHILPEPTLSFSPSHTTGEPPPVPSVTPLALLDDIEPSLETAARPC